MHRINSRHIVFISLIIWVLPTISWGQDTLGERNIEVVKEYKPTTAEAIKIKMTPELPTSTKEFNPSVNYEVPHQPVSVSYQPSTIRALAMRKESPPELDQSYFKIGAGNYATPLLEAYYNSGRNDDIQYGGWARHTSSRGSKIGGKKIHHQNYSENQLHLFGKYLFQNQTLSGELDYSRDVVHYYGYNQDSVSYADSTVQQRYHNLSGEISFQNHNPNQYKFDYEGTFSYSRLTDRFGLTEEEFRLRASGRKQLSTGDDFIVDIDFRPIYRQQDSVQIHPEGITAIDTSRLRVFTTLNPKFYFRKPEWKLKLQVGGKVTFVNDELHILPDIYTERVLFNYLTFYSGWEGTVHPNHYHSFTDRNPFLTPLIRMEHSRSLNSYGGIKGSFADHFSYKAEFSYKNISHMPLFVNDSLDQKQFRVVYDDRASILNFHAQISYQLRDRIKVSLNGDYNSYDMTDFEQPWHVPQVDIALVGHYNFQDIIHFSADIHALEGIYVREDGSPKKLPLIVDANVKAQYFYKENLSFFLNLENVAGSYERWHHYPSYGMHIMGGVNLRF